MNSIEERLARYRYELDAVQATDAVGGVRPSGAPRGNGRRALLLVAATVLVIAGLVAVTRRGDENKPTSDGGSAPFAWTTSRVAFTANTFTIDVGGQRFSPTGVKVDVNTDPGDATYATLELSWQQHQVPMNVNIYLAADATSWWVTEMRTYNGKSGTDADWLTFMGEQFRTPAGGTYAGDVDLTATEGGVTSHVQIGGMTLALLPSSQQRTPSSVLPTYATLPSDTAVAVVGTTTIPVPAPPVTDMPEQWYSAPEATTGAAIAQQFGASPDALAALNGWTDGPSHLVTAGSTVRIPPGVASIADAFVSYGSLVVDAQGSKVTVGASHAVDAVCLLDIAPVPQCDPVQQPVARVVTYSTQWANGSKTLIYGIADSDLSISVVDATGAKVASATVTPAYQGREAFAVVVNAAPGLSIVALDGKLQKTTYPVLG